MDGGRSIFVLVASLGMIIAKVLGWYTYQPALWLLTAMTVGMAISTVSLVKKGEPTVTLIALGALDLLILMFWIEYL